MNLNNLTGVLLTALVCLFLVSPASGQERILSFDSTVDVHEDASMTVTETITVRAEGDEIRRGIFRDFPTDYTDRFGNRYTIPFEVQSVRRDGEPEPHFTESRPDGVRLYIGREDRHLDPGVYEYRITYETDRAIGYFEEHDELYWNVTGHDWNFPIEQATFTLTLPDGPPANRFRIATYTGYENARQDNYEVTRRDRGEVSLRTTESLESGQGLTVAVGWPKGIVEEPSRWEEIYYFLSDNLVLLLGMIFLIIVGIYYLLAWIKVGVDPEKGTIIPRYEPPDGLSPAAARYVMQMGYDDQAFTAALINLAVNGYVEIEESGGDYTVRRNREVDDSMSDGERKLAQALFSQENEVKLEQDNHERIRDAMEALEDELEAGYRRTFFLTNTGYVFLGLGLSVGALLLLAFVSFGTVSLSLLFMLAWLSIWSIGLGALLKQTYNRWVQYFRSRGSRHLTGAGMMTLFTIPFLIGELVVLGMLFSQGGLQLFLIIMLFLGLNALFYVLLKAPTVQGRKLMDKIQGLKRYLRVAEKDRLDLDRLPDRTPELFERLLPYAVALEVGNEWAKSFAGRLDGAAGDPGEYRPGWYHGSYHGANDLTSDLSGTLSSTVATSSSPPGSSSGSGGGGSVGGGAGGGGGGGW